MGVITKGGDQGYTSLFNGRRVLKSDPRVVTYGWVDLLNSHLGVVLSQPVPPAQDCGESRRLEHTLHLMLEHLALKVQPELFNVGALLATEHESEAFSKIPRVHDSSVVEMEQMVKEAEKILPPMRFFIMPRGNLLSAQAHVARAVCRHVESVIIDYLHSNGLEVVSELVQVAIYLNRLSDYLFILARVSDNTQSYDQEQKWIPSKA
ncbi:cob(I)yrinic acid a,c-diamide adenosyltransferase [Oscillatoria amoena NRMC-F 0135]|nr:cob(I)yrinic acid a,c-diamide adenosyltransferase [Oscillatoria laete-virens]MDL5047231.1 cob(I)yrinic acid a,c-diamide adenosyltransferase [Oscillatoria amoena NRMC-F 0135]MDL5052539.1 cob(I)yrinic acid a,c-diamide adenosyltransferase [Oscillatoria laete-virens NRMC-F 0139]